MSTFSCQQLASTFNWGPCSCQHSPMPIVGSVSNANFPYSTFSFSATNKSFARTQCCQTACEAAQSANPIAPILSDGPLAPPSLSDRKRRPLTSGKMRSASGTPNRPKKFTPPKNATLIGLAVLAIGFVVYKKMK